MTIKRIPIDNFAMITQKITMQSIARYLGMVFIMLTLSPLATAQSEIPHFDIDRFIVEGNTLLTAGEIEATLHPFTGKQSDASDIRDAVEALRQRYRSGGFSVVWVVAPEQDLDKGVVLLQVIEARVGTITINGNKSFDDANIRASLPALMENALPRAEDISENIQLTNQNPSKQVDVTLRPGETPGVVDATVDVIDERAFKGFMTLDNTGNEQTGQYRLGVGARYANLFNRDHIFTLSYTSSPNSWEKTSLYSASYRLPLYSLGDSIDLIAAYSDVNVGTVQTVAGGLDFAGQGVVYNIRYNQLLTRRGPYSHQLVYGVDYRSYKNQCTLGIFGAAGCGPAALDVTVTPISLAYSGNWSKPGSVSDFYVALSRNFPRGPNGNEHDFNALRPSPNGGVGAPSRYNILRLGGSIVKAFDSNWQVRTALSAQYTHDALISGEQFGFTGATSVRGFSEREIVRDTGNIVNIELYSPNFAGFFLPGENNVRGLLFYDFARGTNKPLDGELNGKVSIASAGVGIRWNFARNFNLRFDMARIVNGGGNNYPSDLRGHISIFLSL
jgi:hemolysin activation/secretion protein